MGNLHIMKLAKTLRQEYENLETEVKEKYSFGDYASNPTSVKIEIETIKNICIGKKEYIQRIKQGKMKSGI